jgi:hypothetical protein
MIINQQYGYNSTAEFNLGDSDHFAKMLCFMMNRQNDRVEKKYKKICFVEETLKNLNTYSKRDQGQRFI